MKGVSDSGVRLSELESQLLHLLAVTSYGFCEDEMS